MTVKELFNHFKEYPARIVCYDAKNNIEDKVLVWDENYIKHPEEYEDFIDEYGEYNVVDWSIYDFSDVHIQIN